MILIRHFKFGQGFPLVSTKLLDKSLLDPFCRDCCLGTPRCQEEKVHLESWLMRFSLATSTVRSSLRQSRRAPWICTSCRRLSSLVKVDLTPPNNHKPYYVTTPIYYVNAGIGLIRSFVEHV